MSNIRPHNASLMTKTIICVIHRAVHDTQHPTLCAVTDDVTTLTNLTGTIYYTEQILPLMNY